MDTCIILLSTLEVILRNQVRASLRPVRAWFKNIDTYICLGFLYFGNIQSQEHQKEALVTFIASKMVLTCVLGNCK